MRVTEVWSGGNSLNARGEQTDMCEPAEWRR